jgi:hypothetical protein
MDTQEFEKLVKRYAKEIKTYAELRFPAEAANTALRFINGNFRAQGWQGASFKPWKKTIAELHCLSAITTASVIGSRDK